MSPGYSGSIQRIKLDHTHDDGKVCYTMSGQHRFEKAGLYALGRHDKPIIVAYVPYTGHWYAYDPKTGAEIATFTRDFYEECVEKKRIGNLVPDPDCVAT